MRIRLLGAVQMVICAFTVVRLYREVNMPPLHQATLGELVLALAVVVTGLLGVLMLVAGDSLLAHPE